MSLTRRLWGRHSLIANIGWFHLAAGHGVGDPVPALQVGAQCSPAPALQAATCSGGYEARNEVMVATKSSGCVIWGTWPAPAKTWC
jgi:hypothetical protein